MKNYIKYIILGIVFLVISFGGYFIYKNTKDKKDKYVYTGVPSKETRLVSTLEWVPYSSKFGFSFMHDSDLQVKEENDSVFVGGIVMKIERLNCKNPTMSEKFSEDRKIYGFKANINEAEKLAYICNNTNTGCIKIEKDTTFFNKTEITEGFFHSFISTLNINKDFNNIPCLKS